ncbi:MAG: hypothetical protein JWO19_5725 [Bryobacterales bacterium]|nr:hypothetical protein [Bryobacterales bacterium]
MTMQHMTIDVPVSWWIRLRTLFTGRVKARVVHRSASVFQIAFLDGRKR